MRKMFFQRGVSVCLPFLFACSFCNADIFGKWIGFDSISREAKVDTAKRMEQNVVNQNGRPLVLPAPRYLRKDFALNRRIRITQ